MNRRKFLKITGLTALASLLPFEAIAETTWADIQHADDIVVHGDLNVNGSMIVEHEPYYARCEVNMDYDFNDIFLYDAETKEPIVLPKSEPLPFSYEYVREYKRN